MDRLKTIQFKLIGLVSITSFSAVIVGILAIVSLRLITSSFSSLFKDHAPVNNITQSALLSLDDANSALNSALLILDQEQLEAIRQNESEFNRAIFDFEMYLSAVTLGSESDEFKNLNGGLIFLQWQRKELNKAYLIKPASPESKNILAQMTGHIKEYVIQSQEAFTNQKKILRLQGDEFQDEVSSLTLRQQGLITSIYTHKDNISDELQKFLTENDKTVETIINSQDRFATLVYQIIFVLVLVNFLLVFVFGMYFTGRLILTPIRKLTKVVSDISIGKLDAKIDQGMLESKDEIGELARAFDRTVVSLKLAMKEQGQENKDTKTPNK